MHAALPSRPLAPLAARAPTASHRRAASLVARFQAAGGAAEPEATIVHFEVAQAVPYGQRVAVVGDAAELGAWQPEKAAVLEWGADDVWTGKAKITAAKPVEYKLLTVGDDGAPITWQAGPNRVLELSAAEVKVADSLEAEAGPTVEPVVVEAAAAAPAPTPAAPAAPAAPAPKPAPPSSAVVAAAAAAAPTTTSLASLTVKELKARLTDAGLPVTGKKADLLQRLEKHARGL